ncbi:hypothetical protein [Microbulbifer spongiae]|uniref:Uncharacterized protein n=1 Tax=Microbulbifer spongiae TaxID=2944933 RepID=A0ABY9E7E0_9GAMM|nr:hypothetical protein [Microbulbifer sp. MI-G]WKD48930.1 hypothetical protein M8T91_13640 [Microbulbifer sp. MI-G]
MPKNRTDSGEACKKHKLNPGCSGQKCGEHTNADKTRNGCGMLIVCLLLFSSLMFFLFERVQKSHDAQKTRDITATISLADWKSASEEARWITTIALFNMMKEAKNASQGDQKTEDINSLKRCLDKAAHTAEVESQQITEHATLCIAQIAQQTPLAAPAAREP